MTCPMYGRPIEPNALSTDIERKFEKIAKEATDRAAKVECSIADYAEGLQVILDEVSSALEAARIDLDRECNSTSGATDDDE